jgi:hypothetical protein
MILIRKWSKHQDEISEIASNVTLHAHFLSFLFLDRNCVLKVTVD